MFKLLVKAMMQGRTGTTVIRWIEADVYSYATRTVEHIAKEIDPDFRDFKASWDSTPKKSRNGKKMQPYTMRDLLETKFKAQKDKRGSDVVSCVDPFTFSSIPSTLESFFAVHSVHESEWGED